MKDKLLLWIEGPLHFCLAYYLQKMYDCEIYAIIDVTSKPKKFYANQDLVKFKKIWFFHDHINKIHTPDVGYLSSFEKKYDINIWKLAINERLFYNFYNFHKFSSDEILSIDEDSCKFFEEVLDEVQPNYLLTYLPNLHHQELLFELSNANGVKSLLLSNPILGYKSRIAGYREMHDSIKKFNEAKSSGRDFKTMKDYLHSFDISKQLKASFEKNSASKLMKAAFEFLFASDNKHQETHYTYFGRTKLRVLKYMLNLSIKKRQREKFMQKNLLYHVNFEKPFVYYPLGVEPEANILITAPFFTNQTEIIRNVAKALPVGYELYVKENPSQISREWREISEYKEMMEIPNVKLLHWSVPSKDIIEKCSLVISIKSSSSIEAALRQKPSIIFSNVGFNLPNSIHKILDIIELPKLIKKLLNSEVELTDLNRYVNLMEKISFVFKSHDVANGFKNYFQKGGYFVDNYILESKMKECITEYYKELEILADEYIKKIHIHSSEIKN